jgi:glutaredoxin
VCLVVFKQGVCVKMHMKFLAAALLVSSAGAHAQMYKWVGPDGKITYTDTPPPPVAVSVEKKKLTNSVVDSNGIPFELAEVVKASPVIIYTGANCVPCDAGRRLLVKRGIPFGEKTITTNADIAQLGAANSEVELPQLLIGRGRQRGFDSAAWNAALTSAGYPTDSKLPKEYRNPPPEAAAPESRSANKPTSESGNETGHAVSGTSTRTRRAARPVPQSPAPANESTPPGFRF